MSGPNGEGLPATAALPTHILVTDELVDRAMIGSLGYFTGPPNEVKDGLRAALTTVAPELFAAGMRAATKLQGGEELLDTSTENSDTTREVGTGGGYELDASGQIQAVEEEGERPAWRGWSGHSGSLAGDLDQAGQEGVEQSPGAGWWKSPPAGAAESD